MNVDQITILLTIAGAASGAINALQSTSSQIEKMSRSFMILGREITMLGIAYSTAVSAPLGFMVKRATSDAIEYENIMRSVAGISSFVRQNFTKTYNEVSQLAIRLGLPATKLAETMRFIYSSGFEGAEGLRLLEIGGKAAVAGLAEPEEVIRGLIAIMTAYRLKASDMADVSDLMFRAVDRGIFTYKELVGSMSNVITGAAAAKVPLKDLFASYVLLSRAGFTAHESGTAINRVIREFFDPAKEASSLARALGINLSADALITKGFGNAIVDVARKVGLYEIVEHDLKQEQKERIRTLQRESQAQEDSIERQIIALERQKNAINTHFTVRKNATKAEKEAAKAAETRARRQIEQLEKQIKTLRLNKREVELNARARKAAIAAEAVDETNYEKILVSMSRRTGLTIEQLTKLFPDVRALRAMLILTAESGRAFNEVQKEMGEYVGATERVFQEQTRSVKFHIDSLTESFKALGRQFLEENAPAIIRFLDRLRDLILRFQNASKETRQFAYRLIGMTIAVGPAMIAFGQLLRFVGLVQMLFIKLRGFIFGFSIGILKAMMAVRVSFGTGLTGAVTSGVASIGLSLLSIAGKLGLLGLALWTFKEIWDSDWNGIKTGIKDAAEKITATLLGLFPPELQKQIRDFFQNTFKITLPDVSRGINLEQLKKDFQTFIKPLVDAWNEIKEPLRRVLNELSGLVFDLFLNPLSKFLNENIKPLLEKIGDWWKNSFKTDTVSAVIPLLETLEGVLKRIREFFKDKSLFSPEIFMSILFVAATMILGLIGLSSLFQTLGTMIPVSALAQLLQALIPLIAKFASWAVVLLSVVWFLGIIVKYSSELKELWDYLWNLMVQPAWEILKIAIQDFVSALKEAGFEGVVRQLKEAFDILGRLINMLAESGAISAVIVILVAVLGALAMILLVVAGFFEWMAKAVKWAKDELNQASEALDRFKQSIENFVKNPSLEGFGKIVDDIRELAGRVIGTLGFTNPFFWPVALWFRLDLHREELIKQLQWIRDLLPFSPAKEGPLSTLPNWFALFHGLESAGAFAVATTRRIISQIMEIVKLGLNELEMLLAGEAETLIEIVVSQLLVLTSTVRSSLRQLTFEFMNLGQEIVSGFVLGFTSAMVWLEWIPNMIRFAFFPLLQLPALMAELGASIIAQLISGIVSGLPGLQQLLEFISGLFPHSPAKWGPFRELPDWSGFFAGFDSAFGRAREMALSLGGREMQLRPLAVHVHIGTHEIRDVTMEWAYEAIGETFRGL